MTCFLSHIKGRNSYFLYLSWLMCLFWEKSLPLHFCVPGMHPNRHKELQMTTASHLLLHGSPAFLCLIGFSYEASFSDLVDTKCWHLLRSEEIMCFGNLWIIRKQRKDEAKELHFIGKHYSKRRGELSHSQLLEKCLLQRTLCCLHLHISESPAAVYNSPFCTGEVSKPNLIICLSNKRDFQVTFGFSSTVTVFLNLLQNCSCI